MKNKYLNDYRSLLCQYTVKLIVCSVCRSIPSSMTSQIVLQQPQFYSKPSTSHLPTLSHNSPPKSVPNKTAPINSRIPPFYSEPPPNAPHPITSATNASIKVVAEMSHKPSPSLPPDHPPPVKCTQLREKERVCMVSRTKLEVNMQYDHDLIEIENAYKSLQ